MERYPVKILMIQVIMVQLWILLSLLLVQAATAAGQSDAAAMFLDGKESTVQSIAALALQNYRNSEALAETCSSNCSRGVCMPLKRDSFTCESVQQSPPLCRDPADNNSTCKKQMVSRDRGFVRWSLDANLQNESPTCDMKATICAQQQLDEQIFFKTKESADFVLQAGSYFGASNGIMRVYPGTELNDTVCNTYDIRQRSWYVGTTAVKKDIVVLLDAGPSMGAFLSFQSIMRVFDASKNITLRLLHTLSDGDRVSLFTFGNSSSSEPISIGQRVSVTTTPSADNLSILEPLKQQVQDLLNPDTSLSTKANLTAGLATAVNQFDAQSLSQMKVVIVITAGEVDGEFLEPSLIQSLDAANVTLFIYRLIGTGLGKENQGGDEVTNTLQNASCHLSASYEEVLYDGQNPIGVLQSFYSYTAKLRHTASEKPFWVRRYQSLSQTGDLNTVAYPVFNESFLVGVAAIDVIIDNLGEISSDVTSELANRNILSSLEIPNPPRFPCSQQYSPRPSNTLCPSALDSNPGITGFCTDVDKTSTIKDRMCCKGFCGWPASHGLSTPATIGLVVGIVGGIVLIAGGLFICWRKRHPPPEGKAHPINPGSEQDSQSSPTPLGGGVYGVSDREQRDGNVQKTTYETVTL